MSATLPKVSDILSLSLAASQCILQHYGKGVDVERKVDKSPVTIADKEANALIVEGLGRLTPDIPVVAEEDETHALPPRTPCFWLVDPLDGTKSFIKQTGEFTVNIGLISGGIPILGVVVQPAAQVAYYTGDNGNSYRIKLGKGIPEKISARMPPKGGLVVVASASHRSPETDEYIKTLEVQSFLPASSSLKFCMIAEGAADIYPRFGPTMEWDTAAADAILRSAGGKVETIDGKPLTYAKPEFRNPNFIASGRK